MLEHGITKSGCRSCTLEPADRLRAHEELLLQRVDAVVEHYRDIGIDVVNSTGDQFSLFCESLPGDRLRLNAYAQRQPLRTIAGGMPIATVGLGDGDESGGGWTGRTSERPWAGRSIVHFDPLVAAARNRPTAVAITGEPGGGKTTLALLLLYQMALRGVTIAAIDPKGDAESRSSCCRRADAGRGYCRWDRPRRVCWIPSPSATTWRPEDDGHRDVAVAAPADVRGARVRDDPGGRPRRQRAGAVPRQGGGTISRPPQTPLRRTGCGTPVDVGDAAGPALLRPVRWRADRHRRVDHGVHPRWLTLPDSAISREDYSYEQRLSVALMYLVSQFAGG